MSSSRAAHASLAATLRELRTVAGLSQVDAATASGLTQAKISRLENGRHTPRPEDVTQLTKAYRAPARIRHQLERTARDLVEGRVYSRIVLQRGAWRMQQQTARIEEDSDRIQTFQPTLIPGLLQTRAYARAVFSSVHMNDEALDRTVEARLERQNLLHSGRVFVQLMTEGALLWQVGSPQLMIEQLEYVVRLMDLSNVHIGIITHETAADFVVQEGFNLYDRRAVVIGTTTATATITEEADVAIYHKQFSELENLAEFGKGARRRLERVAEVYGQLLK